MTFRLIYIIILVKVFKLKKDNKMKKFLFFLIIISVLTLVCFAENLESETEGNSECKIIKTENGNIIKIIKKPACGKDKNCRTAKFFDDDGEEHVIKLKSEKDSRIIFIEKDKDSEIEEDLKILKIKKPATTVEVKINEDNPENITIFMGDDTIIIEDSSAWFIDEDGNKTYLKNISKNYWEWTSEKEHCKKGKTIKRPGFFTRIFRPKKYREFKEHCKKNECNPRRVDEIRIYQEIEDDDIDQDSEVKIIKIKKVISEDKLIKLEVEMEEDFQEMEKALEEVEEELEQVETEIETA